MRGITACLLLVGWLALGVSATEGQAQPRLSVSPEQGPAGTVLTIVGDGFVPGDTVYVEVWPGVAPDSGTVRLATVTADDLGRFRTSALMPPEGFENWGRIAGRHTVMAYPHSFGDRTRETIEAAPKMVFAFTPGAPPPTGLGAPADGNESGRFWALFALGVAAALSAAAVITALSARREAA